MTQRVPIREPTPDERRRTCFRCTHATYPGGVTRCSVFDETIESELFAARDCLAYQEGPSG